MPLNGIGSRDHDSNRLSPDVKKNVISIPSDTCHNSFGKMSFYEDGNY